MDYKKTLNNPNTTFEMRANLAQKEPLIQQKWNQSRIYKKLLEKSAASEKRILHDGPPYANGMLHVGHALNKILKDMIVRMWFLRGYNSAFVPGWDTHGLPIEHAVSTSTSGYMNLAIPEKRNACLKYAKKQIEVQKDQFSRFGLLTDFSDCYYTFQPDFENDQLKVFASMVRKGLIYRDLKPVYWSWSSRSALADAEIEYKDEPAHSIYVSFTITNASHKALRAGDRLLIWTTTPWTIPANQAINIHPTRKYSVVAVSGKRYIVDSGRLQALSGIFGWTNLNVVTELTGQEIAGTRYAHALYKNRINTVLPAEYVSAEDGTGLVHCAPGFGPDDFYVCKKAGMNDILVPIDDAGKFTTDFDDERLRGIFYLDSNPVIVEMLKEAGALLHHESIVHSEPHDWRTKKPVIYRATRQWFIRLDGVRDQLINAINGVSYQNQTHKKRMLDMVAMRAEWCISRQRVWGVPIPLVYDEHGEPLLDASVIDFTIEKILKHGTNSWFDPTKPASFFVPDRYASRAKEWRKESDIMDVWFDSGSSFTTMSRRGVDGPVALYLEGNDQYRGWFNSSMICSVISRGLAPFEGLVSHGIVLDAKGNKMSKSLGNVINPLDICSKYGADVLRLWVASVDYSEDSHISNDIIEQVAEQYRKIRNTLLRFPLSNIFDFDYKPLSSYAHALEDKVAIAQINATLRAFDEALEKYRFQQALKALTIFVGEFSGWYLDLAKDTLYCDEPNSPRRRATQSVLNYLLAQLLPRLSVLIPHTAEEAYGHWGAPGRAESIMLINRPQLEEIEGESKLLEMAGRFSALKNAAYAAIEALRRDKVINKTNEAALTLPEAAREEVFAPEAKR